MTEIKSGAGNEAAPSGGGDENKVELNANNQGKEVVALAQQNERREVLADSKEGLKGVLKDKEIHESHKKTAEELELLKFEQEASEVVQLFNIEAQGAIEMNYDLVEEVKEAKQMGNEQLAQEKAEELVEKVASDPGVQGVLEDNKGIIGKMNELYESGVDGVKNVDSDKLIGRSLAGAALGGFSYWMINEKIPITPTALKDKSWIWMVTGSVLMAISDRETMQKAVDFVGTGIKKGSVGYWNFLGSLGDPFGSYDYLSKGGDPMELLKDHEAAKGYTKRKPIENMGLFQTIKVGVFAYSVFWLVMSGIKLKGKVAEKIKQRSEKKKMLLENERTSAEKFMPEDEKRRLKELVRKAQEGKRHFVTKNHFKKVLFGGRSKVGRKQKGLVDYDVISEVGANRVWNAYKDLDKKRKKELMGDLDEVFTENSTGGMRQKFYAFSKKLGVEFNQSQQNIEELGAKTRQLKRRIKIKGGIPPESTYTFHLANRKVLSVSNLSKKRLQKPGKTVTFVGVIEGQKATITIIPDDKQFKLTVQYGKIGKKQTQVLERIDA